jgi:hypothetical protein
MKQLAVILFLTIGLASPAGAQVKITPGPEQVSVEIDGKPFTVFYVGGKDLNRPYLHPLRRFRERASTIRIMPASSTATAT